MYTLPNTQIEEYGIKIVPKDVHSYMSVLQGLIIMDFDGANERPGFVWVTVSLSNRVLPIGIIGFALLETQNNWIADFQCMCMRERACVYA